MGYHMAVHVWPVFGRGKPNDETIGCYHEGQFVSCRQCKRLLTPKLQSVILPTIFKTHENAVKAGEREGEKKPESERPVPSSEGNK